ncbi:acyltransferase [Aerococcaceae bacterium 50-4]
MIKNIIENVRLKLMNPSEKALFYKEKKNMNIGEECQIFNDVSFGSEPYLIKIGDKVKITAGTQFVTHDGGVEVLRNLEMLPNADLFGQIHIGSNVFIGNKCIILPGVTIGDNVIIGAGSVVTKNINSNSVCAGVPAREIRTLDEYYSKNKDRADYTKSFSYEKKKEYLIEKFKIGR